MEKFGYKISKSFNFYPILFEDENIDNQEDNNEKDSNAENLSLPEENIENYDIVYAEDGTPINIKDLDTQIESCKMAIIGQSPFFRPLVHELNYTYTWLVPTMATDGTNLFINPKFANKLTWKEKAFVITHELTHCVLLHNERLLTKNHYLANKAMDYEVNAILLDTFHEDYKPPDVTGGNLHGLYDEQYLNVPAEIIYEK